MVDAAIELVVHPAGRNLVEHRKRLVDQIVIVEQPALLLFAAIVRRRRNRDMQQRLGTIAGNHSAALFDQRGEAHDLVVEQTRDRRILFRESLGEDSCPLCFLVGEKDREKFVDLRGAGHAERKTQLPGLLLVLFAAVRKRVCDFRPAPAR